jgi:L-2,4-diaminobutyric acid acetyltransferase
MKIIIRNPKEEEFLDVYKFVSNCKPLENYYEHFYKIMLRYFRNSCVLAKLDDDIVGFMLGFTSQVDKDIFFLWQIGVKSDMQNRRIGKKILEETERLAKNIGCTKIHTTVDPGNIHSQRLFEKNGFSNISKKEAATININERIAVKDYYSPDRHFILFEKEI